MHKHDDARHFQTYRSLYQCNSSYRRGGHRGTAPVTDSWWQETFQKSSRLSSFPRGNLAPRWLNSPSSNKKQIRNLAERRCSSALPPIQFLYLESEKQLDGIRKRGRRWQTEPSDQAKEKKVEKGPGETQRWSKPLGDRETPCDWL